MFSPQMTGMRKLLKAISAADLAMRNAIAAAVYQKALQIDAEAEPLVPVKTGRLKGSHYVAPPKNLDDPESEVGFGTDYALAVHEMMGDVNWTREGSGPKYLERPFKKHERGYITWIGKKAWENFQRGIKLGSVFKTSPEAPAETG